jgi:hypothetical protein
MRRARREICLARQQIRRARRSRGSRGADLGGRCIEPLRQTWQKSSGLSAGGGEGRGDTEVVAYNVRNAIRRAEDRASGESLEAI